MSDITISGVRHVLEALLLPGTLLVLALGVVMAWILAGPLARWLGVPKLLGLAALVSVTGIIALTIVPFGGLEQLAELDTPVSLRELSLMRANAWREALTDWTSGIDGPLNVLLFIPAGFCWELVLRRPRTVLAGLTLLSIAVEIYQGITDTRIANPADVVANTVGALVGVTLAFALWQVWRAVRSQAATWRCKR